MQSAADGGATDTYYDYICVVDFEATCEEDNPPDFLHEIIEFPMVLINTHTLEIVSPLSDAFNDKFVFYLVFNCGCFIHHLFIFIYRWTLSRNTSNQS